MTLFSKQLLLDFSTGASYKRQFTIILCWEGKGGDSTRFSISLRKLLLKI